MTYCRYVNSVCVFSLYVRKDVYDGDEDAFVERMQHARVFFCCSINAPFFYNRITSENGEYEKSKTKKKAEMNIYF